MPHPDLDLNRLRIIAQMAMTMPTPWVSHDEEMDFIDAADGEPIGQVFDQPEILEFWLSLTPPTVLALIARAEAAEAKLAAAVEEARREERGKCAAILQDLQPKGDPAKWSEFSRNLNAIIVQAEILIHARRP